MSLDPKYKFDYDAFIRGILEFPNDYFCREVFADWLEERDEADFAATIRAGFELHRANDPGADTDPFKIKELKNTARGWWSDSETNRLRLYGVTEDKVNYLLLYSSSGDLPSSYVSFSNYAVVDRGFISELYCTKAFFWHYGVEAFSRHPITKLTITNFQPQEHSMGWEYGCRGQVIFGTPSFDEDLAAALDSDANILFPWKGWHDQAWYMERKNESNLKEVISDYLVDTMRIAIGLPELYVAKYPNGRGRGTWRPVLGSGMQPANWSELNARA